MVEETKILSNLSCVHIDRNSYPEKLHGGSRAPLLVRGRTETHSTLLWVLSDLWYPTPLDRLLSGPVDREGLRPGLSYTEMGGRRWGPVLEREEDGQNYRKRSSTMVLQKPLVRLHWHLFLCGTDLREYLAFVPKSYRMRKWVLLSEECSLRAWMKFLTSGFEEAEINSCAI